METYSSQATFSVQDSVDRIMLQLAGPMTGDFVSWIPGVSGPSSPMPVSALQNGMRISLLSDSGDKLSATLHDFTPAGQYVGLSLAIEFSPKISRSFGFSLFGSDPLNLSLRVNAKHQAGWRGPKREDEIRHWKETLACIQRLHSSMEIKNAGFG